MNCSFFEEDANNISLFSTDASHFLLFQFVNWFCFSFEIMKVKVAQSCLSLSDPMDCTVYGILQARMLEWVAVPFSRGSSQPRDWTQVSHIAGRFFTIWATREDLKSWMNVEFYWIFFLYVEMWLLFFLFNLLM